MREDFSKLIELFKVAGTISGRKKLQKIVYVLQTMGVPFDEPFKFHYFGPYSSTLQLEIDALVSAKVLKEKAYNSSYRYSLIPGEDFQEVDKIASFTQAIRYLNGLDAQTLELAATMLYLKRKNDGCDEEIVKKALALKPELKSKLARARRVYDKALAARLGITKQ